MQTRITELDAIRGIAALMVVIYHYTIRFGEIYGYQTAPAFTFSIGHLGVQLFFIVSGLVIFLTLDKTKVASDFIVSRFSRLYPAYWCAIITTFTAIYLFSLPGREVSFGTMLINLTMLQEWMYVRSVDGVYWTLAVELSFYVIMFTLFMLKQLKNIEWIALFWLIVILASHHAESRLNVNVPSLIKLSLLLTYGNLFIAGIMFYKIAFDCRPINYVIIVLCLLTQYYLHPDNWMVIGSYFLVFFLFSKGHLKFLAIKPFIFLGTISYSLYLIHQNIGYIVILKLQEYGLDNKLSIIFIPTLIAIAIAYLMQKYVEAPSLKLIRSKWKQRKEIKQRIIHT